MTKANMQTEGQITALRATEVRDYWNTLERLRKFYPPHVTVKAVRTPWGAIICHEIVSDMVDGQPRRRT